MIFPGLANAPVDEMGVVYVFGMVAHRLGFVVFGRRHPILIARRCGRFSRGDGSA